MSPQKRTYLDHNATTPIKPAVLKFFIEALEETGNPSSIHKAGRESRRRIEAARARIESFVGAGARAVTVFTSGATEANNLALRGTGAERVLVSAIEHPSILNLPIEKEIIPVLPSGLIDLDALGRFLEKTDRSTLVSIMYVNNETGVVQPLEQIASVTRRHSVLLHVDAVQAAGRLPIDMQAQKIDYLSLSGHKMGGPTGVGCLVAANCAPLSPLLFGGKQEKALRAGTENTPAISAFGLAAELAAQDRGAYQKLGVLRDKIENKIKSIDSKIHVFGEDAPRVPNTLLFARPGLSAETMLIGLDLEGVCVGNGSACSSGTVQPSHVLQSMGASAEEIASTLRISLGWTTTENEVDSFLTTWEKLHARMIGK